MTISKAIPFFFSFPFFFLFLLFFCREITRNKIKIGGSCPFPTSAPLSTESLGELNADNITNSLVGVIVTVPVAEKRTVSSIVFGDSAISNDPVCGYPGPSFTKDFDGSLCQDTFTSSISIVDLIQNCGFDLDTGDTGAFREYDGRIWMTIVEDLGTFRGVDLTRTVSSSLNLILSLPSTVTVNGSISLFGAAESIFVLTDQSFVFHSFFLFLPHFWKKKKKIDMMKQLIQQW